jgi:hypothetical protein
MTGTLAQCQHRSAQQDATEDQRYHDGTAIESVLPPPRDGRHYETECEEQANETGNKECSAFHGMMCWW